ncbi:MAG: DUF2089 domain-containing protein [Armatimonadota bacterium]
MECMPEGIKTPTACSVCSAPLEAVRLQCRSCGTALEGHFDISPFARLSPEQHQLLMLFLQSRGNVKDVERAMGLSYPTVRNRLDGLLQALGLAGEAQPPVPRRRVDILKDVEDGTLSVEAAVAELETLGGGG